MIKSRLLGAVCVTTLSLLSLSAWAIPVSWELSGTLLQGGTANGSFIYDADTAMFSNIMLTTSSASPTGGLTFTEFSGDQMLQSPNGMVFLQQGVVTGDSTIALVLTDVLRANLTNSGGVLLINTSPNNNIAELFCTAPCLSGGGSGSNWDELATNTLTGTPTVPIPAAIWLFGSGLLGLIGIARGNKAI